MFPLSIEGAIDLTTDGSRSVLDRVKIAVAAMGAKSIERQNDRLIFRGPYPLTYKWNVVGPLDQCEIFVEHHKLMYKCSTKNLFLMATIITVGFGGVVFFSARSTASVAEDIVFLVLAWIWLFGGNYFLASRKLRSFLVRAANESGS